MPSGTALDSNVLIAAVVEGHIHHTPSASLLLSEPVGSFAVTAHSFAEMYATLTKHAGGGPYRWTTQQALTAVTEIASRTQLIGLSPVQMLDAVCAFAKQGGIGARLYDYTIGEAVMAAGLERLITWNTAHFRSLFPGLIVLTPEEALK